MADTNGKDTEAKTPATGAEGNGGVKAQIAALKDRALEEAKTYQQPEKTDVWKSVLRVKHDETPRSRALGVLSNVFLHLHPAKINRDAVAYNYTGGWAASASIYI